MPSDLLALPLEILTIVTRLLSLRDFCGLRLASKALFTILGGESTCLEVVKVRIAVQTALVWCKAAMLTLLHEELYIIFKGSRSR